MVNSAELDNVVNEAALLAGRQNKKAGENIDFINAVERSTIGIEKKFSRLEGGQKAMVARHEVGHAIANAAASKILSGKLVVEKLSIVPRFGGVLGFTSVSKYLNSANELRGQLVTLLGGIAAEQVLYPGQVSIGSWDDIERATELAYDIVAINLAVGPISITELSRVSGRSMEQGHLGNLVQREIKLMLQSAQDVAVCVMRANLTVLNGLGACLEEKEKLEGDELQEWLNSVIAPNELADFVKGTQENDLLHQASISTQE